MHVFVHSPTCALKCTTLHPPIHMVSIWPHTAACLAIIIRAAFTPLLTAVSHLHTAPAPPSYRSAGHRAAADYELTTPCMGCMQRRMRGAEAVAGTILPAVANAVVSGSLPTPAPASKQAD